MHCVKGSFVSFDVLDKLSASVNQFLSLSITILWSLRLVAYCVCTQCQFLTLGYTNAAQVYTNAAHKHENRVIGYAAGGYTPIFWWACP